MEGGNSIPRVRIILCIKSCKMISTVCLYHVVRVKDLEYGAHQLESVPVVKDFSQGFPYDLPGIIPEWKTYFGIDLLPNTKPI